MIAVLGRDAYGDGYHALALRTYPHHMIAMDDGHVSGGRDDVGHRAEWADDHQDLGHGVDPLFSHSIIVQ